LEPTDQTRDDEPHWDHAWSLRPRRTMFSDMTGGRTAPSKSLIHIKLGIGWVSGTIFELGSSRMRRNPARFQAKPTTSKSLFSTTKEPRSLTHFGSRAAGATFSAEQAVEPFCRRHARWRRRLGDARVAYMVLR
jgi:hypothetical protein